ncbi:DNA internalization-related competence protein ComEC/Rec2 [Dokdonella immobilis]|uniref:Competence protein ComEC n=1 Tax=Dokdonella immobilis TaxID=578942 RepID=A0A1I4W0Q1_9GAMM|nr:DNA internalization-related competence protein ComEC/Rec2 [Dokdonella immobilis]SFN07158.1 competence protein ComEC [Dokdonella immobilis]
MDTPLRQANQPRSSAFALPTITVARGIATVLGAVAVQALTGLPSPALAGTAAVVALGLLFVRRLDRLPVWFLLGFFWTAWHAQGVLGARLPDALHGRDFDVVGTVRGLPNVGPDSTRFDFDIASAMLDGKPLSLRGRVRLNWYDKAPELSPCTNWQLRLRLRPPRGLVNPGGHDSERGAAQRGVVAVGYVREDRDNRSTGSAAGPCIDLWRQSIAQAVGRELGSSPSSGLLRALAVGDQSAIGEPEWQVLRATGIGHLIAISGLHVGMFAAFGALLGRLLWKLFPRLTLRIPGPLIEAPVAMACAFGYGMLAGMGVPTVRTLLMIAIALLARFARRATSVAQALALAALAIVAWDPLAVLSAGFWLSFVGVAILLSMTRAGGIEVPAWRELPRVQLGLSLALLPLSVWFFGQGSLIGPIANLIAVPWVSFLVVPLTVAGSLLVVDWPALGGPLLHAADHLLTGLWRIMEWLAALPSAQVYFAAAPLWALLLALVGTAWMLLPRGVPVRWLGVLLLLPLLVPPQQDLAEGEFEAWMFDVGQGLAVLVHSRDGAWLYDAGPRYPSGFDVGEAVVIPSLHALGIGALDRIVISHGDSDHAGGARALHLAFPDAPIESGEPDRLDLPAGDCPSAFGEATDDVQMRGVSASRDEATKSNDRSCVILVAGRYGSLLLTGDATSRVEPAIAAALGEGPRPLVMSVPHHGSKTASSSAFLDALSPQLGLISAGYRNQFGHPHADVLERYAQRAVPLMNTGSSGYLHLRFGRDGLQTEQGRLLRSAWWRMR